MSYSQRQREATGPAQTPGQYEHWWRERQRRSDEKRGRPPVRSATIPSDGTTAIFDPDQFRLIELPRRIMDLEKGLQHSHSESSLRSNTSNTSISSNTALLEKATSPTQQSLPPKRYHPIIRRLRYSLFAVYQRLFTSVFLLNLAAVLILLHLSTWNSSTAFKLTDLATLASSNFLLAILFRQDWLINALFRTAWLVPWSLPLKIRRIVSRVYCYGGVHSGAAVVGMGWWIAFTAVLSWEGVSKGTYTPLLLVTTLLIASLLVAIVVLSLPGVRVRYHDTWELTHRFLGWLSIALFWAQILLMTQYTTTVISLSSPSPTDQTSSFVQTLIVTPTFWILIATTALLIYPWLLLRRWTFTATPLSDHALQLSFPNRVHKYSCLVLSSSPLREWHPFATFPNVRSDGAQQGSSLVVSAAGDWTKGFIAEAQRKTKALEMSGKGKEGVTMEFWVKSHPRAGVLSLSCLYKRVLILTTGSGIGPCLSSLLDRPAGQVARLVWSTRSPRKTYGDNILNLVGRADPEAAILDTDEMGRPDLLQIAWTMYKEMDAEAVFVLSNEKVTKLVVGGLERRGVPAFGPIWDS